MRKLIAAAALIIMIITGIVWLASVFLFPEPLSFAQKIALFFVTLASVIGVIASFKDVLELLLMLFPNKSHGNNTNNEPSKVAELIGEIQENLNSNRNLTHTLTLCLELCDQIGLSGRYGLWIRKELEGFYDNEDFATQFENKNAFVEWMDQWVSYRWIKTYFKSLNQDEITGKPIVVNLNYEKIFVADPLANMVERLESARKNGITELSFPFSSLGEQHVESLRRALHQTSGQDIQREADLFYNLTELNRILNQVRTRILEMLSEIRAALNA